MTSAKRNHGDKPGNPRATGEISFNYQSYDGRFWLGVEPWRFETAWSAGGASAIHIYNDPPSISGVAIAEGIEAIEQITADVIAQSDFTSRVRTPRAGQCVILENQNGYFAAVQISKVNHSNLPSENILTLRYVILGDGGRDFSPNSEPGLASAENVERVLLAAIDANAALAAVQATPGDEASPPQFGHNRPPAEFALTEAEHRETLDAVAAISAELVLPNPERPKLAAAARVLADSARSIGAWMAAKADLAIDEFAKSIGKATAIVAVGLIAAWAAVFDKLNILIQLLAGFSG